MVQASQSLAGARLAAFAAGCLGVDSPFKAGAKLGLMGSVSESEFLELLTHLEVLARRRAAKLANATPEPAAPGPCTPQFEAAVSEACGSASLAALFASLPHDASGRADILPLFGMRGDDKPRAGELGAVGASGLDGVPCDDVASAGELPKLRSIPGEVVQQFATGAMNDAAWKEDARILNAFRAMLAQASGDFLTADVLSAASLRCCSKRPALSKIALRFLIEASGCEDHVHEGLWQPSAQGLFKQCLSAFRGSKAIASLAESALNAVTLRVEVVLGCAHAVGGLLGATRAAAAAKTPQAAEVLPGLQALERILQRLHESNEDLEKSILGDVAALCNEALEARTLSSTRPQVLALRRAAERLSGGL